MPRHTQCPHVFVRRCFESKTRFGFAQWLLGAQRRATAKGDNVSVEPQTLRCDICFCKAPMEDGPSDGDPAAGDSVSSTATACTVSKSQIAGLGGASFCHQTAAMKREHYRAISKAVLMQLNDNGVGKPTAVAAALLRQCCMPKKRKQILERQAAAARSFPLMQLGSPNGVAALEDALLLSRFAALAYGPAYLEGFFSSVAANALLGCGSFNPYITPLSDVHRRAARVMMTGNSGDGNSNGGGAAVGSATVQHAQRQVDIVSTVSSADPYAASYCIFVDHERKWIVVAFRGTVSSGDIITDLDANPVQLDSAGMSGHAPQGFVSTVTRVVEEMGLTTLLELEKDLSDYQTILTGHSLGAIEANLFFAFMKANSIGWMPRRRVVAFSSAPCISLEGARKLSDCASSIQNYCYGHDVVPRLQVHGLREMVKGSSSSSMPPSGMSTAGRPPALQGTRYVIPGTVLWLDHERVGEIREVDVMLDDTNRDRDVASGDVPGDKNDALLTIYPSGTGKPWKCSPEERLRWWNAIPVSGLGVHHHFLANVQRHLFKTLQQQCSRPT